jgi:hypothetical protein
MPLVNETSANRDERKHNHPCAHAPLSGEGSQPHGEHMRVARIVYIRAFM